MSQGAYDHLFTIKRNTGVISTTQMLDREDRSSYKLQVTLPSHFTTININTTSLTKSSFKF